MGSGSREGEGLPASLRQLLTELGAKADGPGRYKVGGAYLEVTADSWTEFVDAWQAVAQDDSGPDAFKPEFSAGYASAEVEGVLASKGRTGLTVTIRDGECAYGLS